MKMLATFIHELGHHHDFSARLARGRWRADDPQEREIHAEAIEHAWTRDCVVPYLEEAYPAEVDELRRWLEQHGGIALPLDVLLGDPRRWPWYAFSRELGLECPVLPVRAGRYERLLVTA
jgi:hypothetical protein